MTRPHALAVLQASFDDEGAALCVRRYIVPSLRTAPPPPLTRADRAGVGRALLLLAAALWLFAVVTP